MLDGDGIKAVKILASEGIKTNVTAMMNVNQAFLAITAGATYASLFFNRIRDHGDNPVEVIKQSKTALLIKEDIKQNLSLEVLEVPRMLQR